MRLLASPSWLRSLGSSTLGPRASELERVIDAADRLIDAHDETFRKLAT